MDNLNQMSRLIDVVDDQEFKHKLIEELHEINLSLRRMSGRDLKTEEPKTYKDFYFTPTESE